MTNHIPTIEELLGLPKRELDAIFRRAAGITSDASQEPRARKAAAQTVENIRRCQSRPPTL